MGSRLTVRVRWAALVATAAMAAAALAACSGADEATRQDDVAAGLSANALFEPVASDAELVVVSTPARARLSPPQQELYDKLTNSLVCPCEGSADQSLATCMAAGESCHVAEVAADTLGYHLEQGRPVPMALDQAIKDLLSAAAPQQFVTEGRPRLGSAQAPIELVVFEDFQCPHCRSVAEALPEVVEAIGPDRVSLVVKHYPLPRHTAAPLAARAAAAAELQGKFWPLQKALFEHQRDLDQGLILALADELGLDTERLLADMESDTIKALVAQDVAEGDAAKLPGTPTIYLNGVDVGDDMSAPRLQRRIELELELRDRQAAAAARKPAPTSARERLIAQAGDTLPAPAEVTHTADAVPSDVYPPLADVMALLGEAERARLVKIAESEICPCGDAGFQSLDACLRKDNGSCQLAVRVGKLAMRGLIEGESDGAIADKLVQEIEAAKKVYTFSLDDVPYKGAAPDKAKLVVVEFADFKCHYCAKASKTVSELASRYGEQVSFVYKTYPLSARGESPLAARAALAAHQQGKFWPMHDLMFDGQDDLSRDRLIDLAGQLGLNVEKFEAALDDESLGKRVEQNRLEGESAKIMGTPAFFINGVRFNGNFDELDKALADQLTAN